MSILDRILTALGFKKEEEKEETIRDDFSHIQREQALRRELEASIKREEALRRKLQAIENKVEKRDLDEEIKKREVVIKGLEAEIEELKREIEAIKTAPAPKPGETSGPQLYMSIPKVTPSMVGAPILDKALKKLPFGPYSFDNFIVGNNNKFVYMAARSVAEMPADAYNPLFIFGGVGLGKTHLLKAIANFDTLRDPNTKVVYATSEEFSNELLNAVENADLEGFREKYRKADVLIIDDIQFLSGTERTQEEFFHTFNALYDAHKQIVISSDRPPGEIATLEDRLRSRFEGGLITDIKPPDLETRKAILRMEAEKRGLNIGDEVIQYIANFVKSNIRTLKGALNRVVVYSMTNSLPINIDTARAALEGVLIKGTVEEEVKPETAVDVGATASEVRGQAPAHSEETPVGVDIEGLKEMLKQWKLEGYITTRLEQMLDTMGDGNPVLIKKEFDEFGNNIQKLEALEVKLKSLEGEGFDEDIKAIREMMLNPDRVEEVEDDIKLLEEKIRGRKELMLHQKMEELKRKGDAAKKELETLKRMSSNHK